MSHPYVCLTGQLIGDGRRIIKRQVLAVGASTADLSDGLLSICRLADTSGCYERSSASTPILKRPRRKEVGPPRAGRTSEIGRLPRGDSSMAKSPIIGRTTGSPAWQATTSRPAHSIPYPIGVRIHAHDQRAAQETLIRVERV